MRAASAMTTVRRAGNGIITFGVGTTGGQIDADIVTKFRPRRATSDLTLIRDLIAYLAFGTVARMLTNIAHTKIVRTHDRVLTVSTRAASR